LLSDRNDFPTSLPRRALRSLLFRAGLTRRLGDLRWRTVSAAPYIHTIHCAPGTMFEGMPTRFDDPVYNAMIGRDSARWARSQDIITAIDDCWIEPDRCLIVGPDGSLIAQSLPHRLKAFYPSIVGYARRRSGAARIDEALVYDGSASTNYYHHLVESVASILLFHEHGGRPRDIPVIVNRWIYDSRFFADLRERNPLFASINWRVQEPGEWIHVGRAYRAHAIPFDSERWRRIRALYGQVGKPAGRRIFLSRDSKRYTRGLSNEAQIIALLERHGFETVYAEHHSPIEQQRIFESASHLVALQGMGLIQQMFMDPDAAHILEIMPSNRLQSEYYWQGWTLGVRYYDVITGSGMGSDGKYRVDPARVGQALDQMLAHSVSERRYGSEVIDNKPQFPR
jgi:capsular polysaccharide biosynthesis protein